MPNRRTASGPLRFAAGGLNLPSSAPADRPGSRRSLPQFQANTVITDAFTTDRAGAWAEMDDGGTAKIVTGVTEIGEGILTVLAQVAAVGEDKAQQELVLNDVFWAVLNSKEFMFNH